MTPLALAGALAALTTLVPQGADPIQAAREALLGGLAHLNAPGTPGRVVACGPSAFPLLTYERDGYGCSVMAGAAGPNDERILACGTLGLFDPHLDGERALINALDWLSDGLSKARAKKIEVVGSEELVSRLRGLQFNVLPHERFEGRRKLAVIVGGIFGQAVEAEALTRFLEDGGRLLVVGCAWGEDSLNPHESIAIHSELNRVLAQHGLAFTSGYLHADTGSFDVELGARGTARIEADLWRAVDRLESAPESLTEAEGNSLAAAMARASLDLHASAPLKQRLARFLDDRASLWERGDRDPLSRDLIDRLCVPLLNARIEASEPDEVDPIPGHWKFPGVPDPGVARIRRERVRIKDSWAGWHSTGLWIPAGMETNITVSAIPQGALLRIGSHSDQLYHHPKWKRWPTASRTVPITSKTTRLASGLGGLLYLEAPHGLDQEIKLSASNAIRAPRLRAGARGSEVQAFKKTLLEYPPDALAPWVELEGSNIIMTLPLDAVRNCDDPMGVIHYWDRTWEAHTKLLGRPIATRPERAVFDVQISAGWLHSGYPIMGHLPTAYAVVDLDLMRELGDWGMFHELGHNSQEPEWTSSNMVEVTCNLFSMHAMEVMTGMPLDEYITKDPTWSRLMTSWLPDFRERFAAGRASFDEIRKHPFEMLTPLIQLQQEFGWEPFTEFFLEHRAAKLGQDPRSIGSPTDGDPRDKDQAVRDQWAERFSHIVGQDVSHFLASCAWPISPDVHTRLARLPKFAP